jgi:predicted ArsR family transcriptional regulator
LSEELFGPGLGETQRLLLGTLKRRGPSTLAELRAELGLAPATLRQHAEALAAKGLVEREGTRRRGRGRPEVVYRMGAAGEQLFPQVEAALLRDLVTFLVQEGQRTLLTEFFTRRAAARRDALLQRVAGLEGAARWAEVGRIFSEQGFMADVSRAPDGTPELRLHHCPLRGTAEATDLPCRAEVALAEALVGGPLRRVEHGARARGVCSYAPATNL